MKTFIHLLVRLHAICRLSDDGPEKAKYVRTAVEYGNEDKAVFFVSAYAIKHFA